jgi:hypothetical protein
VTRIGRWQLVLLDALKNAEAVGVIAVVEQHLHRRPSRAEINAARRTALQLAAAGRLTVHHVLVPAGEQSNRERQVIARVGLKVDEETLTHAAVRRLPRRTAAEERAAAEQNV